MASAPEIQPPYYSYGDEAAMGVLPIDWPYDELATSIEIAKRVTEVSHSYREEFRVHMPLYSL